MYNEAEQVSPLPTPILRFLGILRAGKGREFKKEARSWRGVGGWLGEGLLSPKEGRG